jgi:hypothetical protein
VAAAALVLVVAGGWARPAAAEGERAGSAIVIDPGGDPLDHGGSSTPFTLELPTGAACPGDSANDDYRIQSFVVPDGVDPAGLTYDSTMPVGEGLYALYEVNSNPFVQGLTAMAVNPGDPGVIDGLPTFDFVVFPPETLAEGVTHIGIACTLFNETVRYWDTDIVLTDTPDDRPAQLTWEAVGAPAGSGSSTPVLAWVGLGAVVLVVVGGAVALVRRRPSESRATELTP